jgi:hypothetical protein
MAPRAIEAILEHVERETELDVIAITDHERIDAAVAAQAIARDRGLRVEVVVGEEVTTLGGHLLALWIDRPIRPVPTLRTTILAVHEAGGLAIPGPPARPVSAVRPGLDAPPAPRRPGSGRPSRRARDVQPNGLGKPWHRRVVRFADRHGLARSGTATPTSSRRSGRAGRRSPATTRPRSATRSRPA